VHTTETGDDLPPLRSRSIATADVEMALIHHAKVAEAVIAPTTQDIEGQALCAFITLKEGLTPSAELRQELGDYLKRELGADCLPEHVDFAPLIPRTRSGKIKRWLLDEAAQDQLRPLTEAPAS
jgi:acetyl-CoA synthetase